MSYHHTHTKINQESNSAPTVDRPYFRMAVESRKCAAREPTTLHVRGMHPFLSLSGVGRLDLIKPPNRCKHAGYEYVP